MQGRDSLLKIRGYFPPNSDLVPFSSFVTARSWALTSHLLPLEDHLRLGAPVAILMNFTLWRVFAFTYAISCRSDCISVVELFLDLSRSQEVIEAD